MKIGFIGLGIMGEAMCTNIIHKHDDTVYVYDVVKEKTEKLAAQGGIPCASAPELAEKSDVIITMVPKSEHSKAVYAEILPVLKKGTLCIDMSMCIHRCAGRQIQTCGGSRKTRHLCWRQRRGL